MNYIDRIFFLRQNYKVQLTQFVNEATEELVKYLENHSTIDNLCRTATITRSKEELRTFDRLSNADENCSLESSVVELVLHIDSMLKNGNCYFHDTELESIKVEGSLEGDTGIFTLRI